MPATRTAVLRVAAAIIIAASAGGCGGTDYDAGAGFHEGFLSGYTRDCMIRARPGPQRRQSAAYSRGYADGVGKGVMACRELRGDDRMSYAATALHAQPDHRHATARHPAPPAAR